MKDKKISTFTFIGILVVIFYITPSNSTAQQIEFSLKELSINSSDIIIARTISINSYSELDQKRIFTDIQLEVSDKIKGQFQKQDQLKLKFYGGTVNGITTIVVGSPQFSVGEQSLLFLFKKQSARTGKDYFVVIGLSQGKFNIFTDGLTNEEKVVREQMNVPLLLEKNGNRLTLTNSQSIMLTNLLNYIKTYIK